jgi:hypothetical protein
MDPDDEYDLALKRWTSAIIEWTYCKCPDNGYEFNRLSKRDLELQKITSKCIQKESKNGN